MTPRPVSGPAATVPFPAVWSRSRSVTKWWLAPSVALLAFVVAASGVAVLAAGGRLFLGTGGLLTAGLLLGIVGTSLRSRHWPGRRAAGVVVVGDDGLKFPYSRVLWWYAVALGAGAVPFGVAAFLTVYTDPEPSSRTQTMKFIAPLLLAASLLLAFEFATARIRRGYVLVTADGVTHQSWSDQFDVVWGDLEEVAAVELKGSHQGAGVRLQVRPGRSASHSGRARTSRSPSRLDLPDLTIRADQIQGDAALLFHTLAFYAAHPEYRDELKDQRALHRVLEGRVVMSELTDGGER